MPILRALCDWLIPLHNNAILIFCSIVTVAESTPHEPVTADYSTPANRLQGKGERSKRTMNGVKTISLRMEQQYFITEVMQMAF